MTLAAYFENVRDQSNKMSIFLSVQWLYTPTFRKICFWFGACIGFAFEKGVWEFDSYIIEWFTYMLKSIIILPPNIISIWYSTICCAVHGQNTQLLSPPTKSGVGMTLVTVCTSVRPYACPPERWFPGIISKKGLVQFTSNLACVLIGWLLKQQSIFGPVAKYFTPPSQPPPPSPGYKCVKSNVSRHYLKRFSFSSFQTPPVYLLGACIFHFRPRGQIKYVDLIFWHHSIHPLPFTTRIHLFHAKMRIYFVMVILPDLYSLMWSVYL